MKKITRLIGVMTVFTLLSIPTFGQSTRDIQEKQIQLLSQELSKDTSSNISDVMCQKQSDIATSLETKNNEWITWDNGHYAGALGLGNPGTFYVASHWDPASLTDYDGMEITKISFFPHDPNASFVLMAWTGPNAGTQIMSQTVGNFTIDEYKIVDLDSPIIIDASDHLWFGYAATHSQPGVGPAGYDSGPAVTGYGDMFSYDGVTWATLLSMGFDKNILLSAYVNSPIGLNEQIIIDSFSIHPNPATNEVTIKSEQKIKLLELYNVSGQLINSVQTDDKKEIQLDISRYNIGTYLIKIESNQGVSTKHLLID